MFYKMFTKLIIFIERLKDKPEDYDGKNHLIQSDGTIIFIGFYSGQVVNLKMYLYLVMVNPEMDMT